MTAIVSKSIYDLEVQLDEQRGKKEAEEDNKT
jgi:hypothetical protein